MADLNLEELKRLRREYETVIHLSWPTEKAAAYKEAACRTLPELIAEVERLRAENNRLEILVEGYQHEAKYGDR